jgi:hypothetical protein
MAALFQQAFQVHNHKLSIIDYIWISKMIVYGADVQAEYNVITNGMYFKTKLPELKFLLFHLGVI